MNHLRPDDPSYFGFGKYTNFKYNGKELQETGMYDYGWRQYMPDLGRWYGMDQLSEMYHDSSPYAYVGNNPIMFVDPDGRCKNRPPGEPCPESPGGADNPIEIEEVWIGGQHTGSSGSSSFNYYGASFLSDALASYFGSDSSDGRGGGGGGSATPIDPWVQYRKDLADYRLAQSRRTLYSTIENTKVGQSVSAAERFLFLELPMSFAGGELFVAGWRAVGAGRFLSGVANNVFSRVTPRVVTEASEVSLPTATNYTKSTLKLGQQMHKAYKAGEVVEGVAMKEFRNIPGIRPDFVDFSTKTIYELKPNNPRQIKAGLKQLLKYKQKFETAYPGTNWNTVLDTY